MQNGSRRRAREAGLLLRTCCTSAYEIHAALRGAARRPQPQSPRPRLWAEASDAAASDAAEADARRRWTAVSASLGSLEARVLSKADVGELGVILALVARLGCGRPLAKTLAVVCHDKSARLGGGGCAVALEAFASVRVAPYTLVDRLASVIVSPPQADALSVAAAARALSAAATLRQALRQHALFPALLRRMEQRRGGGGGGGGSPAVPDAPAVLSFLSSVATLENPPSSHPNSYLRPLFAMLHRVLTAQTVAASGGSQAAEETAGVVQQIVDALRVSGALRRGFAGGADAAALAQRCIVCLLVDTPGAASALSAKTRRLVLGLTAAAYPAPLLRTLFAHFSAQGSGAGAVADAAEDPASYLDARTLALVARAHPLTSLVAHASSEGRRGLFGLVEAGQLRLPTHPGVAAGFASLFDALSERRAVQLARGPGRDGDGDGAPAPEPLPPWDELFRSLEEGLAEQERGAETPLTPPQVEAVAALLCRKRGVVRRAAGHPCALGGLYRAVATTCAADGPRAAPQEAALAVVEAMCVSGVYCVSSLAACVAALRAPKAERKKRRQKRGGGAVRSTAQAAAVAEALVTAGAAEAGVAELLGWFWGSCAVSCDGSLSLVVAAHAHALLLDGVGSDARVRRTCGVARLEEELVAVVEGGAAVSADALRMLLETVCDGLCGSGGAAAVPAPGLVRLAEVVARRVLREAATDAKWGGEALLHAVQFVAVSGAWVGGRAVADYAPLLRAARDGAVALTGAGGDGHLLLAVHLAGELVGECGAPLFVLPSPAPGHGGGGGGGVLEFDSLEQYGDHVVVRAPAARLLRSLRAGLGLRTEVQDAKAAAAAAVTPDARLWGMLESATVAFNRTAPAGAGVVVEGVWCDDDADGGGAGFLARSEGGRLAAVFAFVNAAFPEQAAGASPCGGHRYEEACGEALERLAQGGDGDGDGGGDGAGMANLLPLAVRVPEVLLPSLEDRAGVGRASCAAAVHFFESYSVDGASTAGLHEAVYSHLLLEEPRVFLDTFLRASTM